MNRFQSEHQAVDAARGRLGPQPESALDLGNIFGMLRRRKLKIFAGGLIGLALGAGHVLTTAPTYTASSILLIDNRKVRAVREAYAFSSTDSETLDTDLSSQIEVLKSEKIAGGIADKLQLNHPDELANSGATPLKSLLGRLRAKLDLPERAPLPRAQLEPAQARQAVIDRLRAGVSIRRVPRTLVLEISFTSADADQAAKLANAFSDAYIRDQQGIHSEATREAATWLQEQLTELRELLQRSEQSVQKFKTERGMVSANGRLVDDHRLSDTNSQLMAIRAEAARIQVRFSTLKAIIDGQKIDAIVSDSFTDPLISQLRTRYMATAKGAWEIGNRVGQNHEAVVRLRAEKAEYEQLMFKELGRIAETYRSELEIAKSREQALMDEFRHLAQTNAVTNEAQIELRELERTSETYKSLYTTLLQRNQEALQQQSFSGRHARVITAARVPDGPNGPPPLRLLIFALAVGAVGGVAVGLLRELVDKTFRTSRQVREALGFDSVWMLPLVTRSELKQQKRLTKGQSPEYQSSMGTPWSTGEANGVVHYALKSPQSHFAEMLHAIKVDLELHLPGRRSRLVGVLSMLADEGKTTIAYNLGSLLAQKGHNTLLIDADLRNSGLRSIVAPAEKGIREAAREGKPIHDYLLQDPASGLHVLPAVGSGDDLHTTDFLTSPTMGALLEQAEKDFSYVLVDLPPLALCVDVHAFAPRLDAVILVVEWGRIARTLVRDALESETVVRDKCIGVVVNKVDWKVLKRYESTDPRDSYQGRYAAT